MALDIQKTDAELGKQIEAHLKAKGVNTPTVTPYITSAEGYKTRWPEDTSFQINQIALRFEEIMTILGLDITDDSLRETPKRVATMLLQETMWGLTPANFPKCTTVENKMGYDEMVVEKNVTVQSVCEHHWAIIDGHATIAYIPSTKIIGLSKLGRITEYFARRPQIQERLTEQVFHTLSYILETDNVAVLIEADHYCVKSRGIQDQNSKTITSKLGGMFRSDPRAREEFMSLARRID